MNREIEGIIDDLKKGKIAPFTAGVDIQYLVSDLSLSYGEIAEIEEELNPHGASMYEEKFNEMQEDKMTDDEIRDLAMKIASGNLTTGTFTYAEFTAEDFNVTDYAWQPFEYYEEPSYYDMVMVEFDAIFAGMMQVKKGVQNDKQ